MIELSTVLRELRAEMGLPPGAYIPHEIVAKALTERMLEGDAAGTATRPTPRDDQ